MADIKPDILDILNRLNNTSTDEQITAAGLEIKALLDENSDFTQLNLSSSSLGDVRTRALAKALTNNTTLKRLYVDFNNISADGAQALAEVLANNTTLIMLDIGNNNIGTDGAQALAKALTKNTTLKVLYAGINNISDTGAQALAEALTHNTTLEALWVNYNNISDAGAERLAEALTNNTTLRELLVNTNEIGNIGAQALAKALTNNTMLKLLGVNGDSISQAQKDTIEKMIADNKTIHESIKKTLLADTPNQNIFTVVAGLEALEQQYNRPGAVTRCFLGHLYKIIDSGFIREHLNGIVTHPFMKELASQNDEDKELPEKQRIQKAYKTIIETYVKKTLTKKWGGFIIDPFLAGRPALKWTLNEMLAFSYEEVSKQIIIDRCNKTGLTEHVIYPALESKGYSKNHQGTIETITVLVMKYPALMKAMKEEARSKTKEERTTTNRFIKMLSDSISSFPSRKDLDLIDINTVRNDIDNFTTKFNAEQKIQTASQSK